MALVLKIRERRTDFLYLTLCISSGLHSGFSLPTFLSHASPWSTAKQRNISIQHQVSTCLWVYACLCMSLSARGCNWGLPLSPSLISTSTVPVCWHPAIHTQFSIWWENKMEGKKKKKIRQAKKNLQKMTTHVEVKQIWPPMRTPRSILRGTNTVPLIQLAGCTVQSHQQVSLKATDSVVGHQSISSFSSTERIWGSWEKLCLKWYLCVPAFFTVLSWLGLHNKKNSKNTGMNPVAPPWSHLSYMWTTTSSSVYLVNIPYCGCL